tara:strand:+ start:892 stop:1224 length:333 start_codon:yes stop_codon:yes gene_type:complete
MDITLIAIVSFLFLAIIFLLLFLFKSINKKSFISSDGSIFKNQSDLDAYQNLYEKTKPLFSFVDNKDSTQPILGFQKSFLKKLNSEGFQDLKTLIKYRNQLKSILDLINT